MSFALKKKIGIKIYKLIGGLCASEFLHLCIFLCFKNDYKALCSQNNLAISYPSPQIISVL